ncbi:MAG TPA: GAF domain-containing protein [Chloroflexota bacterium]|nr:GAF domain-containing protein [Chloroflexota bacterium]
MQTTSIALPPLETLAFCRWLLGEEPLSFELGRGDGGDDVDGVSGTTGTAGTEGANGVGGAGGVEDLRRWHRLLRASAVDDFSHLLRTMRREAALLAERSMPLWAEVGRAQPLSHAVGRVAGRLSLLSSSVSAHGEEVNWFQTLPEQIVHELVDGYVEVTRPANEAAQRLTVRVAELAALQKINSVVNSSLDLSQVLTQTVEVVAEVMHADVTAIFLYEETGRLVLRATKGLNPEVVGRASLALGEGITGWTAQFGKPVAVADSWRDARFAYIPGLMEEPYHGWLSVPIILFRDKEATSKLIGVLDIETRAVKSFTPEEVAFAETVAGHVAIAIENARLYGLTDDRLREKVQQLQALQRVTATLVSSLDLSEVLSTVARQAATITGTDMAGIFELDEERQLLKIVASHNLSPQYQKVEVRVGEGAVGMAVAEKKPIVVFDAQSDARLRESSAAQWVAEEGYLSMFSVPLISRNRVLGGISVYTRERKEFSRDQIALLFTFANNAAIAIENARLYEEMRRGLDMKSTLLQEMHHRVKNNLQMMASLLRLQMRRTKSEEAAHTLGVTHAQIESLGAAHDLLSQESFGRTTVQEIARRVADIAVADLLPREKRIEVDASGANVQIESQHATLLALVLNELICNAILHGLEDRTEGRVVITARDGEDGRIVIEVRDDGTGLPDGFSLVSDAGLGLSIVQRLVTEQLKGTFVVDQRADGGTLARVTLMKGEKG